ncbi:uncharacterized protein FTOL_12321 [Fusarium torulosum]|uniref:Uncharacterized protein n=1 Tax=Fusarium torulosum TaxID=33205 RepID=A0AAE8MJM3_9HYPO|nr:uncharacterized protein FTOL_12321 [Fusarium torulosum]
MSQTPEKRAAAGAIVNIFGHLGNVISPYFFPDKDQPRYTMAMIPADCVCRSWSEADRLGVDYNPFTT